MGCTHSHRSATGWFPQRLVKPLVKPSYTQDQASGQAYFSFIILQLLTQDKVTFAKSRLAPAEIREETRGRFCKRAILANVPLFRVWGSRNIKNQSFLLLWQQCRERLFGGSLGTGEHLLKPRFFGKRPFANPREDILHLHSVVILELIFGCNVQEWPGLLSDLNGPRWTTSGQMDQNGLFWSIWSREC